MEQKFLTTKEVAGFLRVAPKTLHNYGTQHEVYRPDRPGIWYVSHVKIIEKVWAGIIDEDEGLTAWLLEKERHREKYRVG